MQINNSFSLFLSLSSPNAKNSYKSSFFVLKNKWLVGNIYYPVNYVALSQNFIGHFSVFWLQNM
jgi:hypothetical protein